MPGAFIHSPGCGCCAEECPEPVTITVHVRCQTSSSTFSNINTASVVIKEGGTTIDSCTTASNGQCTVEVLPPGTYDIVVSKTGYKTNTVTVVFEPGDCENRTVQIGICRDPVSISLFSQSCQAGNTPDPPDGVIEVEITGDATANNTGYVHLGGAHCFEIEPTDPDDCVLNLNIKYIVPPGYGAQEEYEYTGVIYPCDFTCNSPFETSDPGNVFKAIPPKSGHYGYPNGCCGFRNLPTTMEYSDDYGSCTLNFGTTTPSLSGVTVNYAGSYVYNATDAGTNVLCGISNQCTRGHTGDVTVWIVFAKTGSTVGVRRWMRASNTITNACTAGTQLRQLLDIAVSPCGSTWTLLSSGNITGCPLASSAISWSIPFGGSLPDTNGTASITGTIS